MRDNNSEQINSRLKDNRWVRIGCVLAVLFSIALFTIVFWLGTESANPWGQEPGPGP